MSTRLLYESHCHTPLCGHSQGEPEAYAAHAMERGLAGLTVTCHGPTAHEWGHCMRRDQWPEYLQNVARAREAYRGQLDVKVGIECDYLPGMEEYWRKFLGENDLSHVLGSVHPQMQVFRDRYWHGDDLGYAKTYFELLARAAETGLFDTLSHPDLVKNCAPREWDVERAMPFILPALDRIAAAGTAMELNTSGLLKSIPEFNPGPEILRAMCERGIPVVLGADAHCPERVADHFEEALDVLKECGFTDICYFVDRISRTVPVNAAKLSLRGRTDATAVAE